MTNKTARALLHRHGLPEDIIDGALCLHAQELTAVQRLRMEELDLTGQKARFVGRIVDLIDPARTPAAVSAAVAPPTNQTALRDRIRLAIARQWLDEMGSDRTVDELDDAEFGEFADAVLAVLPEVADKATVYREAADQLGCMDYDTDSNDYGYDTYRDAWNGGVMDAADRLRRMADETATETPEPHRGDAFEQWLKARRDEWAPEGCQPWQILDQTLEEYRLHADTGTPLGEHVCEARVVGDCECLEQPAAGARQDGSQP